MASTTATMTVGVRIAWWLPLYLFCARLFLRFGLPPGADPADAIEGLARFALRGMRVDAPKGNRWDRKSLLYFQRAPLGHHVYPGDLFDGQ